MNEENRQQRRAGVLLHIASLPGSYGIGSMGKEAYAFADFCAQAGFSYWQILPLVQTGYGDSPYQSVAANSGNPYFIDLETLAEEGLLTAEELEQAKLPAGVDYGRLYATRYPVLRKAFSRFDCNDAAFTAFCEGGKFRFYALYMTLKGLHQNRCFSDWEEDDLRHARPEALDKAEREHRTEYLFWQFLQFTFQRQWQALKAYANAKGVRIVGDIPLYVAYDSADVWAHSRLFALDEGLAPVEVAGCPPDYFCKTGQLWGNPLYRWEVHRAEGYAWWLERIRDAFATYDTVRIDHFRGFDRYYAIPARDKTAEFGCWRDGPKESLFAAAEQALGPLDLIAEDLGVLDEGVLRLLASTGYPGMRILLFAFDGRADNRYLPANIDENSVCYTGTHDNDTIVGYVKRLSERERKTFYRRVAQSAKDLLGGGKTGSEQAVRKTLLELAAASASRLVILPMQDLLGLDNSARMNMPGTNEGNWRFRLRRLPDGALAHTLHAMLERHHRLD